MKAEVNLGIYLKLSSFYFFFFAVLGAYIPFWSLYLQDVGFSLFEIGQLMSLLLLTKIISPHLWGWIADRSQKRLGLVRLGALLCVVFFTLFFWSETYLHYLWVTFAFGFFFSAILPQYETLALDALGSQRNKYGQVRLWGSVGFILMVALLGPLFDQIHISFLLPVITLLLVALFASSLCYLKEIVHEHGSASRRFRELLFSRPVIAFLLYNILLQLSHGPYYTYFSIYLLEHGYSKSAIGGLWALGVIAEVVLFIYAHYLFRYFSLARLAFFALFLTGIRWCLIGLYVDTLILLLLAQVLHAASFALLHSVAIEYVFSTFSGSSSGRGQALYGGLSFGIGGSAGASLSGWAVQYVGADGLFLCAALISLAAIAFCRLAFREV